MKKLTLLCATTALVMPATAFAQSTGSIDFEEETIVVTGTRERDVGGVEVPDTTKAKAVLTDEFIQRQTPGQTVNDVINQLPGVSFTNNDPYGSAGGGMTIRGFDNTRISQTFDGVPLNDSGNYALYSNQQLDPELIEQVNVNLGSTDVDSPTASASGSTVNYRTRFPSRDFRARLQGSVGEYEFFRIFGVIDTGDMGPWDTRAFVSASSASNNNVFNLGGSANRVGKIDKQQYNARIYQPIGTNGDFVSLSGHYNQNRNNFLGSVPLRIDRPTTTFVTSRFPITRDERFYAVPRCTINTVATPGVANLANTCGSTFDERFNPSDTGNIRGASRFTLMDGLVLTIDPSIQFVSANGGGTVVGNEGRRDVNPAGGTANCLTAANGPQVSCQTGYIGGIPYFGRDLNGDGDIRDTVRVVAPSQTRTRRVGLTSSLRWDINDQHTARVSYTFDRARHRQTGETGLLQPNGVPFDVFPINDPLADVGGNVLQKRDRLSFAILHQIGGEYRGEFMDERLTVNVGVRAPFFTRDLNNFCATSSATGFVECFGTNAAGLAAYLAANPTVNTGAGGIQPIQGPQQRVLKYDAILPNVGAIFAITPNLDVFANYSKGIQVPGTDNLYNSFFFPATTESARPDPETTNNFDLGLRYRSRNLIAQVSGWYTRFQNRLASAFDPDTERTLYRNLGPVDKYGVDGSVSYQIFPELSVYAFGSYLWSKILEDVQTGVVGGVPTFEPTAGKREAGAPVYTFGGRIQGQLGPVEIGVQAKRTGPRYVNDVNLPIVATVNGVANTQIFPAKTPAYTLVDVDVRIPLEWAGLNDRTWLQLNVTNLFDKLYVGNFPANLENFRIPFAQIGAPRAVSATLNVGF
jgi:iron complex outermembrane receptor protein